MKSKINRVEVYSDGVFLELIEDPYGEFICRAHFDSSNKDLYKIFVGEKLKNILPANFTNVSFKTPNKYR